MQVWVDDDYCPSCANGGHAWAVSAFATISQALDAVAPGGVVHVLPGRYQEDVVIRKPCTLQGEGDGTVALVPRLLDTTLTVAANDVTVQGLQVTGGKQAAILAIGPDFQRQAIHGLTVRQNVVRGGYFGIAANIDSGWNYGQLPATAVQISDNQVSGCTRAIYVYNAQAEITGNTIASLAPEGIGIYSSEDSVSSIRLNSVRVDAPGGRAIYILDNRGTRVEGNTLVGATQVLTPTTAFALYNYADLALSKNSVEGFYWGASAYTGGSVRIVGNTFRDTVAWAVSVGTAVTTTQVTIAENAISGSYWGIKLDDDGGYGLEANVLSNALTDNVVGVQLAASLQEGQVQIHGNAICGNLVAGLRNESTEPVDATDNWWGANNGPKPGGSGDGIQGVGGASITPWARIEAFTRVQSDGRVTITAALKSDRYRLPNQRLTFSTDRGSLELAGAGTAILSGAWDEGKTTPPALRGEAVTVVIGDGCGQGVRVPVRR